MTLISSNAILPSKELCHSYESFSTCYKDTGLWGTYFVCDPLKCDDMIANVLYQWKRLCTIVTEADVERAKAVLKTNLLVELDGESNTETTDIFFA